MLGLLKKKKEEEYEQNAWAAITVKNTDFKRDSGEVKDCNQRESFCTARLNCVTLQHSEGICLTTYQCLFDAILELARRDS